MKKIRETILKRQVEQSATRAYFLAKNNLSAPNISNPTPIKPEEPEATDIYAPPHSQEWVDANNASIAASLNLPLLPVSRPSSKVGKQK